MAIPACCLSLLFLSPLLCQAAPFGIQVVDADTGAGVSLVELKTTNDQVYHTDNAGWIAFYEPGLM